MDIRVGNIDDLIEALQTFRRRYGPGTPVVTLSSLDGDEHLMPLEKVTLIESEDRQWWGEQEDDEPVLLLW